MTRHVSTQHYQALVAEWRRKLGLVDWEAIGLASAICQMISLIGIDPIEIDRSHRARIGIAVKELRQAAAASRKTEQLGGQPDSLEAWIGRYLLKEGDTLLIPDEVRRAWLARQRDSGRRERRMAQGIQANRIEMRVETWRALRRILPRLKRRPDETLTLGSAIERLIEIYMAGKTKNAAKGDKGRKTIEPAMGDLFQPETTK
jgi:hypothetical protein